MYLGTYLLCSLWPVPTLYSYCRTAYELDARTTNKSCLRRVHHVTGNTHLNRQVPNRNISPSFQQSWPTAINLKHGPIELAGVQLKLLIGALQKLEKSLWLSTMVERISFLGSDEID